MLEDFLLYLCSHADRAHYVLFVLLLLAGVNIPISADILILTGGILVSVCVPEHYLLMFGFLYAGCLVSAYEAYWLGRLLGPKLYKIRPFSRIITPGKVQRMKHFIERYGLLTFLIGRFIPGGVRNVLFVTSGWGELSFPVFMFRDGIAAFFSVLVLFQLGYLFGESYPVLFQYYRNYERAILLVMGVLISLLIFFWYRKHKVQNV